jgi:hypothetical protein
MMQPIRPNGGSNRFWTVLTMTAASLGAAVLFAAHGVAEPLCKEELGPYYVNVGLANDTFGGGLDDAFDVTIQRARPTTLAEVDKLKAFFYAEGKDANGVAYSDGRTYVWQKEGRVYRLFKRRAGKRDVRLELFTITFPPAKRQQYLMRIMNSNPGLYASMNISAKLGVLGVMGVEFRGRTGTMDFINNLQVETSASLPKAYVGNADVMLYRLALDQGYDGVASDIDPSDWAEPKVVLSKGKEQVLLDHLGQFYAGAGFTDDRDDVMSKFGSAITVNGITKEELKYIFLSCAASGDSTHGAPKSVFIPLKVKEGTKSFYPVFIFPAAFGTTDTLYAELRNAALQARWWNAVANANTRDLEQMDLREALLRARVPYVAYGIAKSPTPGITAGNPDYNVHVSLRSLLISAAQAALNNQEQTRYTLPWTVDKGLIMAEGAGSGATAVADGFYNSLFMRFLPDITNFKMTAKHIALTKQKDKEQLARHLASAIASGYTLTKAERTQAFSSALGSSNAYLELLEKTLAKLKNGDGLKIEKPDALDLIGKLQAVDFTFTYDDLGWLKKLTEVNLPLHSLASDPIGIKLVYLADTLKSMKNLDVKMAEPMVIDDTLDQHTLTAMVGTAKKDAGAALQALATSPNKARLEAIQKELEEIKTALPGKYDAKTAVETAAAAAVGPKKQARDDSYAAMKTACTAGTRTFNPALSEHDLVLYKTVWDYHYGDDAVLAACTPKVNAFADARKEYKAIVEQQRPSLAEKAKAIEESLEKTIRLKEELMRLNNGIAQTNAAIAELNSSMQEKSFTWKSWIEKAFVDYFLSGDGNKVAYGKLVKKLERAGVTVEPAGDTVENKP